MTFSKSETSPSWNDQTRKVIDRRLAIDPNGPRFFTDAEWPTLRALCDRILPETVARPRPVPLAAMVDEKMFISGSDGYRYAELPPMREAWRRGLAALDAEARTRYRLRFHELGGIEQDKILLPCRMARLTPMNGTNCPPRASSLSEFCTTLSALITATPPRGTK